MNKITVTLIVVFIAIFGGLALLITAKELSSDVEEECEFGSKRYKNLFGFEKIECFTSENTPMHSITPEVTIVHFEWDSYGTMIIFSNAVQGLIAEINKEKYNDNGYEITFGSGNRYVISDVGVELEVGDIITINVNSVARDPCEVKFVELSNGTVYANDREREFFKDEKLIFLPDDDIEELLFHGFQWSEGISYRYAGGVAPYDPHETCKSYTDYEFVSLDSKIASMDQLQEFLTVGKN